VIVISDTNILSSFAAANSLDILLHFFSHSPIYIPPAVLEELQVAIAKDRDYLNTLIKAIDEQQIIILLLTTDELDLLPSLPNRLNIGERQAIILAQQRHGMLLSNDRRAVRYCEQQGIRSLELVDILRLLWSRKICSRHEVQQLIEQMQRVERLALTEEQLSIIFAPQHR
jgi:predicted nucleic acid-binding protein